MNGSASKALDRDIRRAFGEKAVNLVDRQGQAIESAFVSIGALNRIAVSTDRRLDALEARTWAARWQRLKTDIWPNLWHGVTHPFERL